MSRNLNAQRRWFVAACLILLPTVAAAVFSALQTTEQTTSAFGSAGGSTSSANFETYFIAGQSSPTGVSQSANFSESGGFLASFSTPEVATVTQTIPIRSGAFNMVSVNIQPPLLAVETVLDDLETLVVAQDDLGQFYIPPFAVNTIGDVDVGKGYQIFISGSVDDALINTGLPLLPADYSHALTPTRLSIIGCPYQVPQAVADVFASIAAAVVVVQDDAGRFWIPSFGVNTIGAMQPGKGYQIFVNQAVNFTYPALPNTTALAKNAPTVELTESQHFRFQRTGLPYGIVVTGSEEALQPGDEIGVFAGDRCVGAAVFMGEFPLAIAAWQAQEEHGLAGFESGASIAIRIWRSSDAREVEAVATFDNSNESTFQGASISAANLSSPRALMPIPTRFALEQNYPNPFNPKTRIGYELPTAVHVRVEIFNLMGQKIKTLVNMEQLSGSHTVVWDARNESGEPVASGVYVYRLMAGEFTQSRKLLLQR